MEGFEHYVESIFAAKGPLSSAKVKEGLEKLRFLRSTPEDLKSKVDALPNVVDTNFNDPKVSTKTLTNVSCETNCRIICFCMLILCFLHFLFSLVFKQTGSVNNTLNTHKIIK
jgi:hypothetical protein